MAASNIAVRPGRRQAVLNWVMRGVLATPLLHRARSATACWYWTCRGRKTGRRYRIPVGYTLHDGKLLIGTAGRWRRNLDPNRPIDAVVAPGRADRRALPAHSLAARGRHRALTRTAAKYSRGQLIQLITR